MVYTYCGSTFDLFSGNFPGGGNGGAGPPYTEENCVCTGWKVLDGFGELWGGSLCWNPVNSVMQVPIGRPGKESEVILPGAVHG